MTILHWIKSRDKNRLFTSCHFQTLASTPRCSCSNLPCTIGDIYRCPFIPQPALWFLEIAYAGTRRAWRYIARSVKKKTATE